MPREIFATRLAPDISGTRFLLEIAKGEFVDGDFQNEFFFRIFTGKCKLGTGKRRGKKKLGWLEINIEDCNQ